MKVTTAAAAEIVYVDVPNDGQDPMWIKKYAGRTVTLGMWAKTSDASLVRLGFYDSVSGHVRADPYHTGDDNWAWMEYTHTFNSAMTQMYIYLMASTGASSGTAYLSQPMLVFGSSIGEGNYTRPQGEIVWCENGFDLTTYDEDNAISSNAEINLEAESNGKIPKGAKAVHSLLLGECSTVEGYLSLNFADSASSGWNPIYAQIADKKITGNFWQQCDSDGDIWIRRSHTFNDVLIRIDGVQLR
jgi:hypothetical protein